MGFIPEAFLGLQTIGFDFNNLATLYKDTIDEQTGLAAVESYLDLTVDPIQEIIEANEQTTKPVEPAVEPVAEEELEAPTPFVRKQFIFVAVLLSGVLISRGLSFNLSV